MEYSTFSQKLHRLEDIVNQLESPDVELEQGLKLLEEGIILHKDCQNILTESQAKITTLLQTDHAVSPDDGHTNLAKTTETPTEDLGLNQEELPF